MPLSKKQIKQYKPLIISKLESMGLKDEIQYAPTGTHKMVKAPSLDADGNFEIKTIKRDNYRAANIFRNLYKKLIKTDPLTIERFLIADFNTEKKSSEVLIDSSEGENEA